MANHKLVFSFISMIIFTTFLISVNSQVTFNMEGFNPGDSRITLQGTASIGGDRILQLINSQNPRWNTGRALYSSPILIWDNNGNIASFVTSFSLVVNNIIGATRPADGFIFFLSPTNRIPSNSDGGKLGVVNRDNHMNRFVGVEFDTFINPWDPNFPHIGIDVNSLYSLQTVRWNRISGIMDTVNITYDGPSKTLSVLVTNANTRRISILSQVVDLKAVLPQTIHIGLSATTSHDRQLAAVYSWSFTSTLVRNNNHIRVIPQNKHNQV